MIMINNALDYRVLARFRFATPNGKFVLTIHVLLVGGLQTMRNEGVDRKIASCVQNYDVKFDKLNF